MNIPVLVFVLFSLHEFSFAQPNSIMHSGESSVGRQGNPTHVTGKTLPDVLSCSQNLSVPATHFDTSTDLDKRRMDHKCPVCKKTFHFFSYMQDHWRMHMDICTFRCRLCTKSYKFLRGLRQHLRTAHTGQAEIRIGKSVGENLESVNKGCLCPECGKFFKRCDNLQVHRKTIHDKRAQHACVLCGHVFNRRTNYFKHIRTVHGKEDETNFEQCRQSLSVPLELESQLSTTHKSDHE
ncbi:hypothetical protein CRM22_003782 [Opisthorchis felineus]|uniref:C2H2-type domain-containing protein n=1 Tax=Opisthorchis felineus TaxID=147828 RepID=A0A4S2M5P2_OPIFE|nr:hypothetical protein CRM22_003782 [Opisthorchis felineus]TGZ69358.1 hypothetical protein CRM22_003782 [Opisthorchis felineus]